MPSFLKRHTTVVIASSAAVCAASIWIVLVLKMGMSHAEAVLIAGLALLGVAQLHVFLDRTRDAKRVRAEIDDILVATGELMSDVAALRDDVSAVSQRIGEKNYLHADRLAGQVDALEGMIGRLAEAQTKFGAQAAAMVAAGNAPGPARAEAEPETTNTPSPSEPQPEPAPAHVLEAETEAAPAPASAEPSPAAPDLRLVRSVESAVAERRADIYLQPIVTLPQRKVRFYEALTRLRDDDGRTLLPEEYLGAAGEAGVMAEIDSAILSRSIALVRRFAARKRQIGVFCNLSLASLGDPQLLPGLIEQIEAAPELAGALVLEFTQSQMEQLGPLEEDSLSALAGHGLHLSLDHVDDLGFDFPSLAAQGFRYVKIAAAKLLDAAAATNAAVHPEDLARLAARSGIRLIAEKIEQESTVVNLLDHDVALAQGYLFARPRLVREEAAQQRAAA